MTMKPPEPAPGDAPTASDETGASFHGPIAGPSRLRVGLIAAAAIALVATAAATSFASSTATNGAAAPGPLAVVADPADDDAVDDEARFGGRGFRQITIDAISGNDVTLETEDGWRRTITITGSVELSKGGQEIQVADLRVGDQVRFRQDRNADGTYTVTALAVIVPTIRGEASAITSSGFKVTTRDGSVWTVTVNGDTAYSYGKGSGTLADVKDGQAVRVAGTITAENQMTATSVRVAGDRAVGTVTAKTADTITIRKRDGSSLTIHVDGDTTYRVPGVQNADLGDVAVDMGIGVTGRARADGSIDADAIVAGRLRGLGRGDGQPGRFGFGGPGAPFRELPDPATDEGTGVPTA